MQTLDDLQQALHQVEPRVRLLPARLLRRVIRHRHQLPRLRIRVPHDACCVIGRQTLLEIVDETELGQTGATLPDPVILLRQPEVEELQAPPAILLTRYWRLLFHCRIHELLDEELAAGKIAATDLRQRLRQIGMARFGEIRDILIQENLLVAGADHWAIFVEFAATFLEQKHFAPGSLPHFFPDVDSDPVVEGILADLVDAEDLFAATRPRGAEAPSIEERPGDASAVPESWESQTSGRRRRASLMAYRRLFYHAEKAAARGNLVRACILLQRARRRAPEGTQHRLRNALRGNVHRMVLALQDVLGFSDAEADSWREALSALAARSGEGLWRPETRLLFDLQKICNDRQRRVFAVGLWPWIRSLGRRPLKRPLPWLMEVLVYRHLQAAIRRVTAVRIPDAHRWTLQTILHRTSEEIEEQLRSRLRPVIADALHDAEFVPGNIVERIAGRKLVEELIDRLLDRGFLNLGQLRDAVARNQLKARDLSGPRELISGDQLLRADRRMAAALDGVYRPGESYLRAIQRLSSLAFGTQTGRRLMRYLVLPFGGAYLVEAGIQHLIAMLTGQEPGIEHLSTVLPLGTFLFLLINVEGFRRGLVRLSHKVARGVRFLFVELPRQVLAAEAVQRVLRSRPFRGFVRFGVKPAVLTALIGWVMPGLVPNWHTTPAGVFWAFAFANLLLNSRVGRDLEELTTDWIGRAWHWLGAQVIARLFWLIMDIFRAALELTERVLYSVDEWLRFRSGESQAALWSKATLGVFWFAIAYVARFCINLLIEPQVNPIKHFPVVTVSHKILLPLIPALAHAFELAMEKGLAYTVATAIITATPGIFGFLAWELRENWRLYAANRPRDLRPVIVGKHGETVRRLLIRGLHSGTIPKRYAKLRKADSDARSSGRWRPVRKHQRALRQLKLDVQRFVERELIWLLDEAGQWNGAPICVAAVHLTPTRIRMDLQMGDSGKYLWIALDAEDRWLVANLENFGALEGLSQEQEQALAAGLTGLYKAAGVDMVREEIEAQLSMPDPLYDLDLDTLVVWPQDTLEVEVRYPLDGQAAGPKVFGRPPLPGMPVLDRSHLLLREVPVLWQEWIEFWTALDSAADTRRMAQFPWAVPHSIAQEP